MHRARLISLAIGLLLSAFVLVSAGTARAEVITVGGNNYGVAIEPNTTPSGLSPVTSSQCSDPWLSSDLGGPVLPPTALCWQGAGSASAVMHSNETFAITWDPPHPQSNPQRSYWATTRDYLEQFLSDLAVGSGSWSSPFAETTQYQDYGGRAENSSKFGGGCVDYGNPGGSTCQFGNTIGSGQGNNYPQTNTCGSANLVCVTDQDVQNELTAMITNMGLVGHVQSGYTPLLVLLMPSKVKVCIDGAGTICSANSGAGPSAYFCSYHNHVQVDGVTFAYVVQPWTIYTNCDEPNLPTLPQYPTAQQVAVDAGTRLVGPLSQGLMAAIVNPWLDGWYAENGDEINDNGGCGPDGDPVDAVTVGDSGQNPYYLPPEFNNAGAIEVDPNAPQCTLGVALAPTFVAPSPIDAGDVVAFDGSTTVSTLIVPSADYRWSFGDGTTAVGPSVVHSYAKGGTFTVTLTVTDRGGNTSSFSQRVVVLGANGQPGPPAPGNSPSPGVAVRIKLMPESLGTVLHKALLLRLTSNVQADGIVTVSISRAQARRAHLRLGSGPAVVVGRGTVSNIKVGTVALRLHLSPAVAAKLRRLGHVKLTVRFVLFASGGRHITVVVAGQY